MVNSFMRCDKQVDESDARLLPKVLVVWSSERLLCGEKEARNFSLNIEDH